MWAIARDDRPWGGIDPPAVAYSYAPGRGGKHAAKLLDGYNGILQVDGYAVYKRLAAPARPGGPVTLAYCWKPPAQAVLRGLSRRQCADRDRGARAHQAAL
jgi:transposase